MRRRFERNTQSGGAYVLYWYSTEVTHRRLLLNVIMEEGYYEDESSFFNA